MSGEIDADSLGPDLTMLKVAREIAMDLHPLETILKRYAIDGNRWERLSNNPRFKRLVAAEVEAWESATNVSERIRLKALVMSEEALPEMFRRLHDKNEGLQHKVKLFEVINRIGGLGGNQAEGASLGDKFTVTINLGQEQVRIERALPPVEIEGKVLDDA